MHYGPSRSKPIGTTSNTVARVNVWPNFDDDLFSFVFLSEALYSRFAVVTMFAIYIASNDKDHSGSGVS